MFRPRGFRRKTPNNFQMKASPIATLGLFLIIAAVLNIGGAQAAPESRDRSFDSGWCFLRADAAVAEAPDFDDSTWRTLDVPHDWSIEDLPTLEKSAVPEFPAVAGQWRFQKGDDSAWKTPGL